MVLTLANGSTVERRDFRDLDTFLRVSSLLQSEAEAFKETEKKYFASSQGLLYIDQHEYAICSSAWDPAFRWIASGDATTCHIVIFHLKSTGATGLLHLDRPQCYETVHSVTKKLYEFSNRIQVEQNSSQEIQQQQQEVCDVYVVGGFQDEEGASEKISLALIKTLSYCGEFHFKLLTFFVGPLNTTRFGQHPVPLYYGAAFELTTGKLHPADFTQIILKDDDDPYDPRGPASTLRHIRCSFNATPSAVAYELYDPTERVVKIPKFPVAYYPTLRNWLKAPTPVILENLSTSPYAEQSHFVPRLKEAIQSSLDHGEGRRDIFQGHEDSEEVKFKQIQGNGKWELVKN